VKTFLDTSVLVAAFYGDHQHHERSIALLARQEKATGSTAAHCLAEVYAVVTAMPGKNRASPHEALLFVEDVRARLALVTLDERQYVAVLAQAAQAEIAGGALYDAIIGACALKVSADALYTWNVRHFQRLSQIADRVREP